MRKTIILILGIAFIVLISLDVMLGQPPMMDGPDQASIDGGVGILAAAGGAYVIKKLRDRKKV